jgi:hypothetical protein
MLLLWSKSRKTYRSYGAKQYKNNGFTALKVV